MKIGLITMHNVCNYGAVLQTYALMCKIKEITNDCSIINYIPPIRKGLRVFFPKEKSPFFRTLMSWIKWFPIRLSWQKTFKGFINSYYDSLTIPVYRKTIRRLSDSFDAIITGSDQVWNSDSTRGVDPCYFLEFAGKNTRKIAYAASISSIDYQKKEDLAIASYLSGFESISIREKKMIDEMSKLTESRIVQTVDPTILVEKAFWLKFADECKETINEKYCLMYILGESKNSLEYANAQRANKNVKTVKISFTRKKEADIVLKNPSPTRFVKLFLNSSSVITNSLHGCLFSLISNVNFAIPVDVLSSTRFVDFINTYGLKKYSRRDDEAGMIIINPNYEEINKLMAEKRCSSLSFLEGALK